MALLTSLAACAAPQKPFQTAPLPFEPGLFTAIPAGSTAFSNASLARAFATLTHDLEWGGQRPHLIRFDGPITVGLQGEGAAAYAGFLDRYLAMLRTRAGLTIGLSPVEKPSILVRFVPGEAFADFSQNQCIIVGGQPDWSTFLGNPAGFGAESFEKNERMDHVSAFIPNTLEPYAIRECIIEEVTQSLGIINDLYGLGPSIFNDDDGHTWPTRLDLLFLRLLYQPEMTLGLGRAATVQRAETLLATLNPAGANAPDLPPILQQQFLPWRNRLHRLLSGPLGERGRAATADRLFEEASRRAPRTAYACEAASARAYVLYGDREPDAADATRTALDVCIDIHGRDDVRIADLQLLQARILAAEGRDSAALEASDGLVRVFLAHGKEGNLLQALLLREGAMTRLGRGAGVAETRRRLINWAPYVLGRDNPITRTLGLD